jgi:hypothetical protein
MKNTLSNWSESIWLRRQKEVLLRREAFLARFRTKENQDQINQECFEDLKKVSPEKLVPVICHSEVHGWVAGYLIQKVGSGGSRILAKLENWKILRVKKSSLIKKLNLVKSTDRLEFDQVINLQELSNAALMSMITKKGTKIA